MGGQDGALSRALLSHGLVREEQLRALAARRARGDARPLAEVVVAERLVSREQLARLLDPGPGATHAPTLDLQSPPLGSTPQPASGPGHDPGASSRRFQLERGVTLALGGDLRVTCERLLGQGGMGTVHLVHDASLGRSAALKLVRGEGHPTRGRRFRREIVLTARLDHPGIPPVYQAGRAASGQDYLLMRFVDGEALDAVLDRVHGRARGSLSETLEGAPAKRAPEPRDLLDALVKVAEAVAYAHSRGVVHRDLKPANLMLGAFGETFVMDWGLARDLAESRSEDEAVRVALVEGLAESRGLTQDGALLGTPGYMAPEQARGDDVDARADVFALGALLTEVLTGEPAITGRTPLEVLARTGNAEVTLPRARRPDVAPELDAIAARCLALDPDARYAGAGEVAADLKAYLEGRPVSVHRYGLVEQTRRLVRRHPAPVAALGVASVLTIAGVIAVGRARDVAARHERGSAVQVARGAAEQASGAVAALSSEAALDRRVGALLAALQAAQRWRTLAQDDPAAAAAQKDAALGLGEVALQGEQWSLAAEAFAQALGLGDDGPARAAIERVERARNAEAERRRVEVEAVLSEAASGALGRAPDGREDAVLRLARIDDAATVARLTAALDEVTARLEEALRAAWLEGGAPTRDERAAGEAEVEGLADAVDLVLRTGLEGEVARSSAQRVALAEARLVRRSARSRAGARSPAQLLAARQAAAVGQAALDVAHVAADALGRLRRGSALSSLARHLAAERDPARALPSAMALCRLGGPRALLLVLQARERFGRHTGFGARLEPLLVRLDGEAPLQADTALGHLRRGEAYEARGQLESAEVDYDRALELDPRLAWAFCRRGTVRYLRGRLAEALADYDQAIALDPNDARYFANRANAREAGGDVTGAVLDYDKALKLDPQLAAARMNRALFRQRNGDLTGAHHDFDETLELDPLLIGGWINRGLLLLTEGDLRGAAADLERALALDPRHPNALLGRAMLRRRQGDPDGALADLELARSVAPDSQPAAIVRGQVKADRGDLDGALAELDAVVSQRGSDQTAVDALRERAELRRRRADLQGSLEDLGKALALQPGTIQLLVLRADVRREAGEPRGALSDGERIVQLAPKDARGWIVRGEARSALGDHEGAAADLDRAIALDPRSARAVYARCTARRRAGAGPGECVADLDRALELEPDFLLARSDRGVVRLNLGLTEPAAEDFLRCTQLAPGSARNWSNLGNALSLLGNEGAVRALDRAIALDPRLVDAFVNRGIAYVRQGDARSARRDFERSIELDPRTARGYEGRALTRRDLQEAGWLEDAQRAVTLDPTMAISWCLLAEAQVERRDYRRALELIEKPLALPEHPAKALLMRAVCREKLGDAPGAIADLEAFLAGSPTAAEAGTARSFLERLKAGR